MEPQPQEEVRPVPAPIGATGTRKMQSTQGKQRKRKSNPLSQAQLNRHSQMSAGHKQTALNS